jgi:ABC-type polysaccharide/polyol phosphate export permease
LRDLTHILRILYQALFYLVPIIYPLDRLPQSAQHWFLLNPFYYIITPYRRVIYEGIAPHGHEWAVLIALAFTTLGLGLFLLMKKQDNLIYRL